MRIFQTLMMVLAFSSTGVMAQDYYSPTDKEKEPVARFPFVTKPQIKLENGEKVLNYTLPKMLTGNVNVIRATEVKLPGLDELPNPVQMFVDPEKATITCMGTDSNPGCMVTHRNLSLNKDLAYQEIDRTYYDPELRVAAKLVVDDFHRKPVEHSGNQPIGVIGALKDRDASVIPRGFMKTQYSAGGTVTTAEITWAVEQVSEKEERLKAEQIYIVRGSDGREMMRGTLTGVEQFGNRVRGRWNAGSSSGWFDFEFNNAKTRFTGYYGLNENASKRAGAWFAIP